MPKEWWVLALAVLVFPALYFYRVYRRMLRDKLMQTRKGLLFLLAATVLWWTVLTIYFFKRFEFSLLRFSVILVIWAVIAYGFWIRFRRLKDTQRNIKLRIKDLEHDI
jgi:hypothetical protein